MSSGFAEWYGPGYCMCVLCFDGFPIEDLNITSDGVPEDVCKPCAESEKLREKPS